jgi:hypothetical protein
VFARPCDVNVDNLAWACFGSWATTCIMSGSRASAVAKAQPACGEPHAIDATRLHQTTRFPILSAFRARSRTLLRTQIRDVLGVEVLQPLGGSLREGIVSSSVLRRHAQFSHGVRRVHQVPRRPLVRV